MDSEEALNRPKSVHQTYSIRPKLPIIGFTMALFASVAFYFCHTLDQQVWQQLFSYHSTHLLAIEKPLYQDFYNKRLLIENIGTSEELNAIQNARQPDDNRTLTKTILADRSFRLFLEQKAPIYFSPKKRSYWLAHNKAIKEYIERLSTYQLGIIPERFNASPKIANLFSYIFIETNILNFISNVVLLLLLSSMIERHIKRSYLISFIIALSLTYASLYALATDAISKPLFGLNALVYVLTALVSSIFIQHHFRTNFANQRYLLFIGLCVVSLKLFHDFFYQTMNPEGILILVSLCLVAVVFAQKVYQFSRFDILAMTEQKTISTVSKQARTDYAEALKGLSRFNFKYARQKLRLLIEREPNSKQILESSYHLEKLSPEDGLFGMLAQRRIDDALSKQDYPTMQSIFQDIQQSAPNRQSAKKHISADNYLKMLVLFLQHNDTEKAEHAFMFLELAGQKALVQEACLVLIKTFSEKKHVKKKTHYQALYENYLVKT